MSRRSPSPPTLVRALAGAAALALVTASCASQSHVRSAPSPAPRTSAHNNADVDFLTMAIPHFSEVVALCDREKIDGNTAAVKQAAQRIRDDAEARVEQMNRVLTAWDVTAGHQGHAGHEGMQGMMSADDLTAYYQATGPALDRLFATQIIAHDNAAIASAQAYVATGMNSDVKDLAQTLVPALKAEAAGVEALAESMPH